MGIEKALKISLRSFVTCIPCLLLGACTGDPGPKEDISREGSALGEFLAKVEAVARTNLAQTR
jgi:hypothetical protein